MPGRGPLYSPGRQNAASGDFRSMTSSQSTPAPAWLRPLVDYGPLAAFFAVYWLSGLTAATVAIMAATALALVLALIFERRIPRSEEHTSELQSLMRLSYARFC